jgi:hypothetical protein
LFAGDSTDSCHGGGPFRCALHRKGSRWLLPSVLGSPWHSLAASMISASQAVQTYTRGGKTLYIVVPRLANHNILILTFSVDIW